MRYRYQKVLVLTLFCVRTFQNDKSVYNSIALNAFLSLVREDVSARKYNALKLFLSLHESVIIDSSTALSQTILNACK